MQWIYISYGLWSTTEVNKWLSLAWMVVQQDFDVLYSHDLSIIRTYK